MPRSIIQLVPRITSEPNGVADYASTLAEALENIAEIRSVFLSGNPASYPACKFDSGNISWLQQQRPMTLVALLEELFDKNSPEALLLHFSGYGYEKRGVPVWLLKGLRIFKHRRPRAPILTIFHELYANGWPWRSSFWLSTTQQYIARKILDLSAEVITPTTPYRKQLLQWKNDARVVCAPVFSNVGEAGAGMPPSRRPATAVVFGLTGADDQIFRLYRAHLERIVSIMKIERIVNIGPREHAQLTVFASVPVTSTGVLPSLALSNVLMRARIGFVSYPFNVLGKSGVFAAYAAHGTLPIVFAKTKTEAQEGLEVNRHFLDGKLLQSGVDLETLALMQGRLSAWYESHSVRQQARMIDECLKRMASNSHAHP